jgi:hypothetical protein
MWSNCYLWARWQYRLRLRAWKRAGRPAGREPYFVERASRSEPRQVPHFLVGEIVDHESGVMALESFKPVAPRNVPWYMVWTRLLFRGRVCKGDAP